MSKTKQKVFIKNESDKLFRLVNFVKILLFSANIFFDELVQQCQPQLQQLQRNLLTRRKENISLD